MMRTSFQPLAHLVDAAAEKWLAVENSARNEKVSVSREITGGFRIGDHDEMTFHGLKYQLVIKRRDLAARKLGQEFLISVHKIAQND